MMPRCHIQSIQSIGSTLKPVVQKQVPQRTLGLYLDDAKTPQNSVEDRAERSAWRKHMDFPVISAMRDRRISDEPSTADER